MRTQQYLDALRRCLIVTIEELTGGAPFVVLSPHPDDESLGTGGLIAGARAQGQSVNVIIVTDGSGSHAGSILYSKQRLIDLRCSEVHAAGTALGLLREQVVFLGLPDTRAPRSGPIFDAAVEATLDVIRRAGADTLLVTWEKDPHCDHEASAELAKAVKRKCSTLKLWAYPIWGWHLGPHVEIPEPFPKAVRIDISRHKNRKLKAIKAHASQMTDLIKDDPNGFRFDEASLAPFLGNYEFFIEVSI